MTHKGNPYKKHGRQEEAVKRGEGSRGRGGPTRLFMIRLSLEYTEAAV